MVLFDHLKFAAYCFITTFAFFCSSCSHEQKQNDQIEGEIQLNNGSNDSVEITELIRNVMVWTHSDTAPDIIPAILDKDSEYYMGIDINTHNKTVNALLNSGFFTDSFIIRFDHLIHQINDTLLKEKEFWGLNELPPFLFGEVDPWCLCQDNLPWNEMDIRVISLDSHSGDFYWKWKIPEQGYHKSWSKFQYRFKVKKQNKIWKISYLQGFP